MKQEHPVAQRRLARRLVLQSLYQWQVTGDSPQQVHRYMQSRRDYAKADQDYFLRLFIAITENITQLDNRIIESTDMSEKDLEELDVLVRGILYIGVYELLFEQELEASIVINEAVLLTKSFLHDNAYGYIHSLLDQIAASCKQE